MRHYECECLICGTAKQIAFQTEPYPNLGDVFRHTCSICQTETEHARRLTKKAASEMRKALAENALKERIAAQCRKYDFCHRFLYQSVIITTPLAQWSFDYHKSRITLYHESSVKINFQTGNYAKTHVQFRDRKMTLEEVIDYIAAHDDWRMAHTSKDATS